MLLAHLKREREKKMVPLRQNLLGSLFPEPLQFFVLSESLSFGKPLKRGKGGVNQRRE